MGFAVRQPAPNTCRIIVYKASKKDNLVSALYSNASTPIEALHEILGDVDVEFEMRLCTDTYSFRILPETVED